MKYVLITCITPMKYFVLEFKLNIKIMFFKNYSCNLNLTVFFFFCVLCVPRNKIKLGINRFFFVLEQNIVFKNSNKQPFLLCFWFFNSGKKIFK